MLESCKLEKLELECSVDRCKSSFDEISSSASCLEKVLVNIKEQLARMQDGVGVTNYLRPIADDPSSWYRERVLSMPVWSVVSGIDFLITLLPFVVIHNIYGALLNWLRVRAPTYFLLVMYLSQGSGMQHGIFGQLLEAVMVEARSSKKR
jgi:hypothetical protein